MKSQLNVMRRLAAVFGVALFLTQLDSSTTPAQAFMDPIGQSKTNDPDYHLKVAACDLYGKLIADLMEMEDLNGKRDTAYWTNKKQRLFESRFYSQPAALPAMKDSRYKPLVEKLLDIWQGPARIETKYSAAVYSLPGPLLRQDPKNQSQF